MNKKVVPALLNLPTRITTPRLVIRPPQSGDGIKINEAVLETFDKLHRLMPWAEVKPSVNESEEYVRQAAANWMVKKDEEPYLPLFMFDKTHHHFIGGTGFHHIDWDVPCLEIGYWLRNSCSNQGFMTEAVNALTRYAIDELKMRRIEIRCDIHNQQSQKVAERLGYHLEATLKSNRIDYVTRLPSDTLIYVRHDLVGLPNLTVTWDDIL